jgi:CheY-like chemotaxis protein
VIWAASRIGNPAVTYSSGPRIGRRYDSLLLREAALHQNTNLHVEAFFHNAVGTRELVKTAGPAVSAEVPASYQSDGKSGGVRNGLIAIIDDDQSAREGINALIASLGYSSATFTSAEEYLGSESKLHTACLILDVHLPGMSGPDLQAHLMAGGGGTPIVFVTALFDERVRNRVIDAGALGYLTKPCDESALINCLVKAVSG